MLQIYRQSYASKLRGRLSNISKFGIITVFLPFTGENNTDWEESMNSHMFFTVHIYQYRVEKNSKNAGGGKTVLFLTT